MCLQPNSIASALRLAGVMLPQFSSNAKQEAGYFKQGPGVFFAAKSRKKQTGKTIGVLPVV
jgi:hypothetical protein